MTGIRTQPENVKGNARYWLDKTGEAWLVSDHLLAAQYAKADSDEYDKPGPWSYEDMWRHGWARVHTERECIWADGLDGTDFTRLQKTWLRDAAIYLGERNGCKVVLARGKDAKAKIFETGNPTGEFLNRIKLSEKLLDERW